MQASNPRPTASQDGRSLRAERSREAIVEVLLGQLAKGAVPSTKEIARLAGVTERTLFNLFRDKDALLLAAVLRYRERALAGLPALPRTGGKRARVGRFVDQLAPWLDEYATVRWAALTCVTQVPDMHRGVLQGALFERFCALLDWPAAAPKAPHAEHALRALVDPLTWRQLRVHQRLGRARAAAVLSHMLLAVTGEA